MIGNLILMGTKKLSIFIILILILLWCCTADENDSFGELFKPRILIKFSLVCGGGANTSAAPYDKANKIHPILLLNTLGDMHAWSDDLPEQWWPKSVDEVELIACVSEQYKSIVNVCTYNYGPDVINYVYSVNIDLWEAKTGKIVSRGDLTGKNEPCPKEADVNLTKVNGDYVKVIDVINWLEGFVEK
jgi:hypothetical protein